MPARHWNADEPADQARITSNLAGIVADIRSAASLRGDLTVACLLEWHRLTFVGCALPAAEYAGNLRGDPSWPNLVGYEVGIGPVQPDGLPEKVGLPATEVASAVAALVDAVNVTAAQLDQMLPSGQRPDTVTQLEAVQRFAAAIHGEIVRIHPFANGNGRSARLTVAWVCARYRLPMFLSIKPRPGDVAYGMAARDSMGRPPDYVGDHTRTYLVFSHLLALSLMP